MSDPDGYDDQRVDIARTLCACDEPTIGESCCFCGESLCPACFEIGGGFCNKQHSQAEKDACAEDTGYNEMIEAKINWP